MRIAALYFIAAACSAADAVPSWVRQAAASAVPTYPAKVDTVVLLQEEQLTVSPDGKRSMHERGAIKFLDKGRRFARAYRTYNSKSGKIRDFQAWLITPDGKETALSTKNSIVDAAISEDFEETRLKSLACPADAPAGSIFAWEITEEEKTVFTQYLYTFQQDAPVLLSRFLLTTPAGWEARGTVMNGPKIDPQVNGTTTTWELRDLPWIADEDSRPGTHSIAPWLGVTYFPSSSAAPELKPLGTWSAISAWLTPLVDPPAEPTPAIAAKAKELFARAGSLPERLESAAAFAQQTNYVSVQINLTKAGGYIPHRADDILTRNYGDCKDKATLMRALLKAQGIESYMVVLYSGDRDYVNKQWPSPFQFNHAIIAIKVPQDIQAPAVIEHPKLGRLLIFDPTNPHVALGDLPDYEQGGYALIYAGADGDLIQLPMAPERNHIESIVTGKISPDSELKAKLVRTYSGTAAASMRDLLHDEKGLRNVFERSLAQRLGGLTLTSLGLQEVEKKTLQATVEMDVLRFGQTMQGKLMMVSPGNLVPGSDYYFTAKDRKLPIKVFGRSRRNIVRLQLPAGFVPDEIPDPVKVSGDYGSYEAYWTVSNGEILFDQTVRLKDFTAPASDYAKVRKFFDQFAGAQGSAVVLVAKP